MIGSSPKRRFVPGTRRKSSMMSASHRKRDSREALVPRLLDRFLGGRLSIISRFNDNTIGLGSVDRSTFVFFARHGFEVLGTASNVNISGDSRGAFWLFQAPHDDEKMVECPTLMQSTIHIYEVRLRNDERGVRSVFDYLKLSAHNWHERALYEIRPRKACCLSARQVGLL